MVVGCCLALLFRGWCRFLFMVFISRTCLFCFGCCFVGWICICVCWTVEVVDFVWMWCFWVCLVGLVIVKCFGVFGVSM